MRILSTISSTDLDRCSTLVDEVRRLAGVTQSAEREVYLLPIEAVGIHVGLVRAVLADPDEPGRKILALQHHYVAAAERERAAQASDPRVALYQRRVTQLLSERQSEGVALNDRQLRALRQDMTALRREIFTN